MKCAVFQILSFRFRFKLKILLFRKILKKKKYAKNVNKIKTIVCMKRWQCMLFFFFCYQINEFIKLRFYFKYLNDVNL